MTSTVSAPTTHRGSCHCGALRYQVRLALDGRGTRCNCSICAKIGSTGAVVKPDAFELLSDPAAQRSYAFTPSSPAVRYFCATCGIHCYSRGDVPELGGAFVGINVNTLDDVDLGEFTFAYWDGRHDNWQAGLRPTPWPLGLS